MVSAQAVSQWTSSKWRRFMFSPLIQCFDCPAMIGSTVSANHGSGVVAAMLEANTPSNR
jgi:hypothetical protein